MKGQTSISEIAWLTRLGIAKLPTASTHVPTPTTAASPVPTPKPRLIGRWWCGECGQGLTLERTDNFNNNSPTFCPYCGAKRLEPANSQDSLSCDGVTRLPHTPRILAQLLYSQWTTNAHEEQKHFPRFTDYLASQLKGENA